MQKMCFLMCVYERERERKKKERERKTVRERKTGYGERVLLRDERISAQPLLCHSLDGTFKCVMRVSWGRQTRSQKHTLRHTHTAVECLTQITVSVEFCMCSCCLCMFTVGTAISSHSPKTLYTD